MGVPLRNFLSQVSLSSNFLTRDIVSDCVQMHAIKDIPFRRFKPRVGFQCSINTKGLVYRFYSYNTSNLFRFIIYALRQCR